MDMFALVVGLVFVLGAGGWVGNWVSGRMLTAQIHAAPKAIDVGLGSNAKPATENELKFPDVAA